jgi:hypothetical protein
MPKLLSSCITIAFVAALTSTAALAADNPPAPKDSVPPPACHPTQASGTVVSASANTVLVKVAKGLGVPAGANVSFLINRETHIVIPKSGQLLPPPPEGKKTSEGAKPSEGAKKFAVKLASDEKPKPMTVLNGSVSDLSPGDQVSISGPACKAEGGESVYRARTILIAKNLPAVARADDGGKGGDKPACKPAHSADHGAIMALSATAITLKMDNGKSVSFALGAQTRVENGGAALAVGQQVVVAAVKTCDSKTADSFAVLISARHDEHEGAAPAPPASGDEKKPEHPGGGKTVAPSNTPPAPPAAGGEKKPEHSGDGKTVASSNTPPAAPVVGGEHK